MKNFLVKIVTLVVISVSAVSCGQQAGGVLSSVQVSTSTQNNDVVLSVSANLNLGAMSFAQISLPILHPQGQTPIGMVELVPGLGGVNMIKVSVNMSDLAGVQTTQAVLPNGNAIPLIANNQTIAVNIGKGARLYLTIGANVTAIGVALPISALDNLGSQLPGLNFFPVMAYNNVIATAGIFTGAQAGQNGIAFIADVSQIVKLDNIFAPELSSSRMAIQAEESRDAIVKLNYNSIKPSAAREKKMNELLFKMNQKKTVLRLR